MTESVSADPQRYLNHISAYDRDFSKWEDRVKRILKKYKMEDKTDNGPTSFPVLWSNVQTLKAATYARMPRPDVARRFRDNDPAGRVAALLLERALDFEVRTYPDFGETMRHVVYDRFLGGRGSAWVRYEPMTKMVDSPAEDAPEALQITGDEPRETGQMEVLDWECAPVDYVHWTDFGHNVCRTWEEVSIIWRKVYLTAKSAVDCFGEEEGNKLPLDTTPDQDKKTEDSEGVQKRALVYEIWDKDEGTVSFLSKSLGKIIKTEDDPLKLDGFFPCPRPIFATLTSDSLVPVPDFILYQDQATELDSLAARIDGLVDQLKVRGFYDAAQPDLARLFKEGENGTLIPVNNWAAYTEKGGTKGMIDLVEILPIAQTLAECYKAFEQIKQQIYELTGISDILRGQTKASETATAQQIKNSYASLRLKVYQDEVERFATDVFRLKAQIICSKFEPETFLKMSASDQIQQADQPYIQPALELLKDQLHREFRIEVETDSMAFQDEQQEKSDRVEFLKATSEFITQIVQASENTPELVPLGVELLKYGIAGFRVGKTLEGVIEQAAEKLQQQAQQQAGQPKPNPEMAKVQAQQQADQAKLQVQQQGDQAKLQYQQQADQARAQVDMAVAHAKQQGDMQLERERMGLQAQADTQKLQHEAGLKQMEAQANQQLELAKMDFERWKAELEARTKIEVAEIAAANALQTAQISAAKQGTE